VFRIEADHTVYLYFTYLAVMHFDVILEDVYYGRKP
jgi:hypothetical protein